MALRIPSVTGFSRTLEESKVSVLRLYRQCLKESPEIIRSYKLPFSVQDVRSVMRRSFVEHAKVSDPVIVDTLVLLGYNDLQECQQNWKTRAHVLQYFNEDLRTWDRFSKIEKQEDEENVGKKVFERMVKSASFIDPGERFL